MMRTVVVGQVSPNVQRTADATLAALGYAIKAIRPGVTGDEVACAAWKGLERDRPNVYFHGGVAYSVGLGFPPTWADAGFRVAKKQHARLEAGMVLHLPIACRDVGSYCVGFSETVAVTENGCDVMGAYRRELIVI